MLEITSVWKSTDIRVATLSWGHLLAHTPLMSFVPAIFLITPVRYNLSDFCTVINTVIIINKPAVSISSFPVSYISSRDKFPIHSAY